MKRPEFTLILLRFLVLLALGTVLPVQADENSDEAAQVIKVDQAIKVNYDKVSDHLSVVAKVASLKAVLDRIARLSGIEVLFDDQADEELTLNFQSDTLEQGLKIILKGRNHILRYSKKENEELLIGVMVLPRGEQNERKKAKRLVSIDKEAYYHRAMSELSPEQSRQMDMSTERWQARLGEMPAERREKLEKQANRRYLRTVESEKRQAKLAEKVKQKKAKQRVAMQQLHEEAMQGFEPERRAAFEQSRLESRERTRAILQSEQH